ncbi:hypothetical protein LSH36_76g05000 [Paralvinella palmiformis]|uniref:SRCR domain-containing protein n=1 Tax=Paralvinella palmiformis TaxID=53620 RepID=A0AAD9NCY0_9ANNE|nr:hypothetical protein LSH36_76g05000 [Paralvinella palmiformis]
MWTTEHSQDMVNSIQKVNGIQYVTMAGEIMTLQSPTEPIWRAEITCTGDEDNLEQCTTRGVSKQCQPASVTCDKIDPSLEDGTLRLSDGPTPYSGRVDVAYEGLWGSICDRLWDETTAGCSGGHETEISQCMTRGYLDQFCKLQRTAGVICLQESAQNLTVALRDPGSTVSITLILYVGIPSGFVLLCVVIIITVLSRKPKVHKSQFVDGTIFNLEKQRSTRNPAYRLDFSLSSHSSLQRTPTTRSSGVYNYILDDEKAYLDLIDEKKEIELGPRSNVPLPVIPRYDADNYLCPISEEEVKDGQLRQGRAIRV